MSIFYIGEMGYDADDEFSSLAIAESAAVEISMDRSDSLISIWNEQNEVISVVISGDIFDKRKE